VKTPKRPAQPFPKGPYTIGMIGDVARILDANGNDVMLERNGMQRLVERANALSKVWHPENHVAATDDYLTRLEQLRKDAWARAQELQAELAGRPS
jgi:hypothetical protein